jgi:hypothetical protein
MLKKLKVPWITKEGYLDLNKFPIDSTLKQAIGNEGEKFHSACRILGSMASAGRNEAGVFLYGLLAFHAEDTAKKQSVVEALGQVRTQRAAELLFGELENTVSSSSTRGYIDAILKALRSFPLDLVERGFQRMLSGRKWSHRMKQKFREFLEEAEYRHQRQTRA